MPKEIIAVSGGFDPIHIGHVRMFQEASRRGDLYVIVNSDDFLMKKKGKVFMPFAERCELIASIGCVHTVVPCIDEDMTVCKTLEKLLPDVFANGGDRVENNVPEVEVCKKHNIRMLWNVGGRKIQSSSDLLNAYGN